MPHNYFRYLPIVVLLFLAGPVARAQEAGPEGLVPDAIELAALRALYTSTNGPAWTNHTNWLQGTTLAEASTWYGVTVRDGDVQQLNLYSNRLSGPLPAELGQLTRLQYLDLQNNAFTGLPSGSISPQLASRFM